MSWPTMVRCPCGADFRVRPCLVERAKYCSNACKYRYRVRPSGLTYEISAENPAWFKKGVVSGRPFQKGNVPANKGKPGPTPTNFKGEDVKYHALHGWVRRHRGRPEVCEHCGSTERMQWANKSYEYHRDLDDWLSLCSKCHGLYDRGHRGSARKAGKV